MLNFGHRPMRVHTGIIRSVHFGTTFAVRTSGERLSDSKHRVVVICSRHEHDGVVAIEISDTVFHCLIRHKKDVEG